MGSPMTYHEAKAALKKRGPGAGLEDLFETVLKMAREELQAAKKAAPPKTAPPRDTRPRRLQVLDELEALANAENPALSKGERYARVRATPIGKRLNELYDQLGREGEPGIPAPAPVVKAAPPAPCCSFYAELERIADATIIKRDHRITKARALDEAFQARQDLYEGHLAQHR